MCTLFVRLKKIAKFSYEAHLSCVFVLYTHQYNIITATRIILLLKHHNLIVLKKIFYLLFCVCLLLCVFFFTLNFKFVISKLLVGVVLTSLVQENGSSLLHSEKQVKIGQSCQEKDMHLLGIEQCQFVSLFPTYSCKILKINLLKEEFF